MGWWNGDGKIELTDQQRRLGALAKDGKIPLSKREKSRQVQLKAIKKDIMRELKQQKLQKRLEKRIAAGEVVQNLDSANNPFESFFDSALEMGKQVRSEQPKVFGAIGPSMGTSIGPSAEEKEGKKTKIIKAKWKKQKNIASFKNDGLFFFDEEDETSASGEEEDKDVMDKLDENDMIYAKNVELISNPVGLDNSTQILLRDRVKKQHEQMMEFDENEGDDEDKKEKKKHGVVSSDILSKTWEDSLKEKKILKKLNVMDFVHNFKDSFFRDVEELNLNPAVLLKNWKMIQQHDGISRKLRLKLGIIMARERARQKKINTQMIKDIVDDMIETVFFLQVS